MTASSAKLLTSFEKKRHAQINAVSGTKIEAINHIIKLIENEVNNNTFSITLQLKINKDVEELKNAVKVLNNKNDLTWQAFYNYLKNIIETMKERLSEYNEINELKDVNKHIQNILEHISLDDIYHLPFISHKIKLTFEDIEWENINRICFRGDDRDPEEIFQTGFEPRDSTNGIITDIPFASYRGVIQLTTRFAAAAFFPMGPWRDDTWIYLVKTEKGFNIHGYSLTSMVDEKNKSINIDNLVPERMFVQELITDHVPQKNIIAAVQIKRTPWKDYPYNDLFKDEYKAHGIYKILGYKMNENCKVSDAEKKLAVEFIEKEILANKYETHIPIPSSGYSLNCSNAGLFSTQSTLQKSNPKNEIEEKDSIGLNLK